jgi:dissimilatory sulfite reductase (desulfoviridin) alpha/beta subunit
MSENRGCGALPPHDLDWIVGHTIAEVAEIAQEAEETGQPEAEVAERRGVTLVVAQAGNESLDELQAKVTKAGFKVVDRFDRAKAILVRGGLVREIESAVGHGYLVEKSQARLLLVRT